MKKAHHLSPHPSSSEFFFRGNGSFLSPNHVTRYIYPSPLNYPLSNLRLQPPANPTKRSRPLGRSSFGGPEGTVFLTITPAGRPAPTRAQFDAWIAGEKARDKKSENALGRAMRRVVAYQGNTLLESGKFKLRKEGPLVYVVKRTTVVPLGGTDEGRYARDEDVYEIGVGEWYNLRPPTAQGEGHDSWWMRLHVSSPSFARMYGGDRKMAADHRSFEMCRICIKANSTGRSGARGRIWIV